MSLKSRSKAFWYQGKMQIYVPKELLSDSQFPLPTNTTSDVVITIKGKRLIVERAKKNAGIMA